MLQFDINIIDGYVINPVASDTLYIFTKTSLTNQHTDLNVIVDDFTMVDINTRYLTYDRIKASTSDLVDIDGHIVTRSAGISVLYHGYYVNSIGVRYRNLLVTYDVENRRVVLYDKHDYMLTVPFDRVYISTGLIKNVTKCVRYDQLYDSYGNGQFRLLKRISQINTQFTPEYHQLTTQTREQLHTFTEITLNTVVYINCSEGIN